MPKRLNRETVVEFVESVLDNRTPIAIDNKVKKEINIRSSDKNKLHLNKSRTARNKNAKQSFLESVESKQTHLNSQTSEGEVSSKQTKLEVKPTAAKISTSFDTDHEDVSGISFKFSQEPLLNSSQDDSFCDVKWDCGSPETIQKVKRWRGQYNAESVKNAVSYFSDIQVKPQKNASSKVGAILHSKELFSLATKSRPQKAKERICKKKPHDVQEMVQSFLQDLTKKNLTGVDETFSSSSVGATSTELCDIETKVDAHSVADDSCHKETKVDEAKSSADDSCWSDDDLFKDNSFLIEATQNQESGFQVASCKNSNGGSGHSLHPYDNLSHGQSILNDSSVIPSSCVAEEPAIKASTRLIKSSASPAAPPSHVFNKPGSVNSLHYCKDKGQGQKTFNPKQDVDSNLNQKHVSECRLKSGAEYQAKCNESLNKFVNKTNQTQSSFRKYSSFHNDAVKPSNTYQPTSCNNSLRKTLSFDSSCSKNSLLSLQSQRINVQSSSATHTTQNFNTKYYSNYVQTPKSNVAPLPHSTSGHVDKKSFSFVSSNKFINPNPTVTTVHAKKCSTDDGRSLNQNKVSREKWDKSATGDGFDVSLPEAVLEQLLEPDDIFDSQADIISNEPKDKEHLQSSNAKCNGNKHSFTLLGKNDISSGKSNAFATSLKQNTCDKGNQNDKPSFSNCAKTLLSPVKSVSEVQKKDQMNSRSPVQTFFKNMLSVSNTSFGTNSSTPIKDWKNMATSALDQSNIKDSTKVTGLSDSFLDNAFDDSFLNDEAVFESQILPYLEKVESDAFKDTESQAPATISSSPVQCSQEQIEQKRQAAIQKRSLRLSQTKKS